MSNIIKTDEDGWGCVPELKDAVNHIDNLTNEIYEINNCVRQTSLRVIVQYMQEELRNALDVLHYIDTDAKYETEEEDYED